MYAFHLYSMGSDWKCVCGVMKGEIYIILYHVSLFVLTILKTFAFLFLNFVHNLYLCTFTSAESSMKFGPDNLIMIVALTSEMSPTRGWMTSAQVRAARLLRPELRVLGTQGHSD